MRKIIIMFAAASVFAACNNTDLETKKDVITTDSTAMFNSNASADTAASVTNDEPVVAAPVAPAPKVITRTKTVYVDRTPKTTTSSNNATQPINNGTTTSGTTTAPTGTSTVPANTGTTTTPAPVEKKEGMSNATKGAVIGGVGGAVGGAIISKKKGTGAVIGGIIGAAGGYILGKKKDKKAAADTTR